ncbi:MAG: hypothetical protein IIX01_02370, partial [Clostridia bacterium]|nr:hypothetical protein [Clostridia bacterium]
YSLSYSAISVIEGATINLADYTALQEVANTEKNNINAAYLFDGWYTGDQKVETFTVTQNVTLKAKWIQKIKLTLNLQNGSKDCINSYSLQINGATVASGSPGKTNQTFTFYVTVGDTVSLSVKSESGFFGFGGAAANILLAGTTTNVPKGETKSVSHTITSNNASGLEIVVKNT